jgi:hypothetical protein
MAEQNVIHPMRGAIAQLGERIVRNDEVVGSIPTSSTIKIPAKTDTSDGYKTKCTQPRTMILQFTPPAKGTPQPK